MDDMAGKNTVELVELCIVNVPHEWYNFPYYGGKN